MILLLTALIAAQSVAERLIDGLDPEAIAALEPGVDVAITCAPTTTSWVEGVEAVLLARGIRTLRIDGTDEELRAAGAEWRLQLDSDGRTLSAALSEIDPGLFVAAGGTIVPRATASVKLEASPPIDPRPSALRPRLGPLTQLAALPHRVLALEACGAPAPELLLVLTLDRLYAYTIDRRRLELFAELSLESLPAAKMPTRDPIGSIVCAEAVNGGISIGAGHGRLGAGLLARLDLKGAGKKRLQAIGTVPGVPLARVAGRWLLGRTHFGKNRWDALVWANDGAIDPEVKLEAPMVAVGGVRDDRGATSELFAIDAGYHVVFLDSKLVGTPITERSGVGAALRRIGTERMVLTTDADRDGERVGVLGSTTRLPIDGPVAASTLLQLEGNGWLVVLAVERRLQGSTLHVGELRMGDGS